jgi:hypothetical protein
LPNPVSCVLSVALPPKVSPVWSRTVSLALSPPWKTRQLKLKPYVVPLSPPCSKMLKLCCPVSLTVSPLVPVTLLTLLSALWTVSAPVKEPPP